MKLPKYNMGLLFSDIHVSESDSEKRRDHAVSIAMDRFKKNNPSIPVDDFDFEVVYDDGDEMRVRATPRK